MTLGDFPFSRNSVFSKSRLAPGRGRIRRGENLAHASAVEHVQKVSRQLVDSENHAADRSAQSVGWSLKTGLRNLDDFPDLIHQKAHPSLRGADHHVDGQGSVGSAVQAEAAP